MKTYTNNHKIDQVIWWTPEGHCMFQVPANTTFKIESIEYESVNLAGDQVSLSVSLEMFKFGFTEVDHDNEKT